MVFSSLFSFGRLRFLVDFVFIGVYKRRREELAGGIKVFF